MATEEEGMEIVEEFVIVVVDGDDVFVDSVLPSLLPLLLFFFFVRCILPCPPYPATRRFEPLDE